jgi:Ca2+-binding EF-hand superfamily protein
MTRNSDWLDMKHQAFSSFANNGRMSVNELDQIVRIGCADGEFDEQEKAVLINVISNLTRADMNDEMWAKVDELIHKFELGDDGEATIESLEDEYVS